MNPLPHQRKGKKSRSGRDKPVDPMGLRAAQPGLIEGGGVLAGPAHGEGG